MKFAEIAGFFESIEKASSRLEMTGFIAELLKKSGKEEIGKIVYLSQGMLAPEYKKMEIGLGEKLAAEAIAIVSGYTRKEIDAKFKELGDLGKVAEQLSGNKKQRSLFSEELSLEKVFSNLEKIAKVTGAGSQEQKLKLSAELLNSASPLEARYIVRIVLGNLRLGIGDPSIMDAIALNHLEEFRQKNRQLEKELSEKYKKQEDIDRQLKIKLREKIEEKYNIYPDLGQIAELLKTDGLNGLERIFMVAGVPIRPTLAERLPTAEEIVEKLGKCAVEAKYDGFRLACHKDGEKVIIFSRRQENVTRMFPEIVEGIKKQVKAKKAIIEGEALAFNEETGEYYPFQVTMQRKRKYGITEKAGQFPLRLFVFDIVFADGKNLMEKTFKERRKILQGIVRKGNVIELTESITTDSPKKINEFFNLCIERGLEGIIAKDLNAKYIAGARKFAWIKLKRSYRGELEDTIDAVIIGYYKGRGQRTKFGLGTLLAAVYNEEKDRFESIAKIGTGMTEQKLTDLERTLSKIKTKHKPARVESGMQPDHWVSPELVVEVNADEITKSPIHAAGREKGKEGYALRFPRLVKERPDKKPEQATTVKEIIKMHTKQKKVQTETTVEEGA